MLFELVFLCIFFKFLFLLQGFLLVIQFYLQFSLASSEITKQQQQQQQPQQQQPQQQQQQPQQQQQEC